MQSVIKKILFVFISALVLVFLVVLLIAWLNRSSVENKVVSILKDNIPAQIEYESSSFWFNPSYGGYTLKLFDVSIAGGKGKKPFLEGGDIIFVLNGQDFFRGKYKIADLYLDNTNINFVIDKDGASNFEKIFTINQNAKHKDIQFNLQRFYFRNSKISYRNAAQDFNYTFLIDNVFTDVENVVKGFNCTLDGTLRDFNFSQSGQTLLAQKEIKILKDSRLEYNRKSQKLSFIDTKLQVKATKFLLEGDYEFRTKESYLDLKIKGMNKNLAALTAFLPDKIYDKLATNYTTEKGKIEFSGFLKGEWSKDKFPNVEIDFGTTKNKDVIVRSKYDISRMIQDLRFEGKLSNGNKNSLESTSLIIKNFQGKLAGKRFKGEMSIINFKKPKVNLFVEASVDLLALHEFYPLDKVDKIRGGLNLAIDYEGDFDDLEKGSNRLSGAFELENVNLKYLNNAKEYKGISGYFEFNNDNINVDRFEGLIGSTDFKMKGQIQNLIPYLFTTDYDISLNLSLISKNLNLDDLLTNQEAKYDFAIAPQLNMKLNCNVAKLSFRKFDANYLKGDIIVKDQELKTTNMVMNTAGGKMGMIGLLNAEKKNYNAFDGRVMFENVEAKRLFKSMENFGSNFPLRAQNIQGRLSADIRTGIVFDKHLNVQYPTLVADIESKMVNGTLQDFGFIKKALEHIGERGLGRKLPFIEMKNILQIRNQSIFVSNTEIKSKLPIEVIGRSTPENGLNYQIKIPNIIRQKTPNTKSFTKDVYNRFTFYINVGGTSENPDAKDAKPSNPKKLEENWQRIKATYTKLFKKNQQFWQNSVLKIDTTRTPYFQ